MGKSIDYEIGPRANKLIDVGVT